MNINWPLAFAVAALSVIARGEEDIHLTRPASLRVAGADATIQGSVDLEALRRVQVTVEPFLSTAPVTPRRYAWELRQGIFQGQAKLFPGLNLVSVASIGGPVASRYVFYVPAPPNAALGTWGSQTPITLTEPKNLRTPVGKVRVVGFVDKAGVTQVDLVVLGAAPLAVMDPSGSGMAGDDIGPIPFRRVPVKNGRFETEVDLEIGGNVLLVRPTSTPSVRGDTALHTLFWEPTSPRLSLEEARIQGERLRIRGRSLNGPVRVSINALVSRPDGTALERKDLWTKEISPGGDGLFEAEVSLGPLAPSLRVRGFPRIEARAGKDLAVRVVLDWPGAQ